MAKPKAKSLIDYRFDDTAPRAAKIASTQAAQLITNITDETEKNIRNLITSAIREGIPPYDAARMIRPMIGLTSAQGQAAMKFRASLIDGGLTLDKVNTQTDKYAAKLLATRADSIARTEIMGALNAGQEESYNQAQDDGYLTPNATQEVILSDDACPICQGIADDGPIPVGDTFPDGGPPFHPQCRCTTGIATP